MCQKVICLSCGESVEPVQHSRIVTSTGYYTPAGPYIESGEHCPNCGAEDDFTEEEEDV